jgi:protein-disulfide isomerase
MRILSVVRFLFRKAGWLILALVATLLVGACSAPAAPTAEPTTADTPVPASPTVVPATPTVQAPAATRTPAQIGPQMEPSPAGPTPTQFPIPQVAAKGSESAKVTIVEFSDFQ